MYCCYFLCILVNDKTMIAPTTKSEKPAVDYDGECRYKRTDLATPDKSSSDSNTQSTSKTTFASTLQYSSNINFDAIDMW